MKLYSTQKQSKDVSLKEAVLNGLAEDGGLYMPADIPRLPDAFFQSIFQLSLPEIGFEVSRALFQGSIPDADLEAIVSRAIYFNAPLKAITPHIASLELFQGPTLSFKDFGACFMAQLVHYFIQDKPLHILVATSGDTGSAIAHAFLKMANIKVWILYPKGKVSWIQEQQLTTMGHNITALEINGTFDDCQRLVKGAFNDKDLRQKLTLTSANSINIARLIPQTFYYLYAYAQAKKPLVISVPSGNFGNLMAGLLAKKMGLPVHSFVASTNINDTVPRYLSTGLFEPRASLQTLSNAMDVGNPSNFARLQDLYGGLENMRQQIVGYRITDSETEEAIREVFQEHGYLLDPHGAVGYIGLKACLKQHPEWHGVFLETAHPAKFADDMQRIIGQKIEIPERLQAFLSKKKQSVLLDKDYKSLRNLLSANQQV